MEQELKRIADSLEKIAELLSTVIDCDRSSEDRNANAIKIRFEDGSGINTKQEDWTDSSLSPY